MQVVSSITCQTTQSLRALYSCYQIPISERHLTEPLTLSSHYDCSTRTSRRRITSMHGYIVHICVKDFAGNTFRTVAAVDGNSAIRRYVGKALSRINLTVRSKTRLLLSRKHAHEHHVNTCDTIAICARSASQM
jgi:hypothetical protein